MDGLPDLPNWHELAEARDAMVEHQLRRRGITDERVLRAMRAVPRHHFLTDPSTEPYAYADGPLRIGHGQTLSQPFIVALMTMLLQLTGRERVLEVGGGSGYQAAVLGLLAAEVHSVEILPQLAEPAERRLAGLGQSNVHVHLGDGSLGWPDCAPYDAILVAAAAPEAPPALLEQLADGGRLVIPVGGRREQTLKRWQREGDFFNVQAFGGVAFVPLRGAAGWSAIEWEEKPG
jgi:protein-L-isoaspartate(D-aspartate) O-methyltransferase